MSDDHRFDDERYLVQAPASVRDGTARVLKHDETFAVLDRMGNIPFRGSGSYGLYHRGTRHLSSLRLGVEYKPLLLLGSAVSASNTILEVDLSNPALHQDGHLTVHHGELHIQRRALLCNGAYCELLRLVNFGRHAVEFDLTLGFMADFRDLFEVRGTERVKRGHFGDPVVSHHAVMFRYIGLDGIERRTRISFSPVPERLDSEHARFRVALAPHHGREIEIVVSCESGVREGVLHLPPGHDAVPSTFVASDGFFATIAHKAEERAEHHRRRTCTIESSSDPLNAWINRSAADIFMMTTETPYGPYPYAGVPWFSAPFGRDGIIAAYECLWFYPDLARGVLSYLAAHQAQAEDADADAEPGKILHECRDGEMAELREIPFGRYYGSVDSTPLFVMLAGAYLEATDDISLIERLWPHIERALLWMERYGDADGDGFLEYGRRSKTGLLQQGWKDSHDSVFHADGEIAPGPIALAEVQSYAYAAWRAAAKIAETLDRKALAREYNAWADRLRERFDEAFWCDALGMYALALDGAKRPCEVKTSNAGQCLWGGIALPERVPVIAEALLGDSMFSGWGVRTLATTEVRYNPMSYHNGSIWPHDNALIALGLARYGYKQHALRIFEAMFDLSEAEDLHRLPELFCGFRRTEGRNPVGYPVACAPQAWSAAAVFALIGATLGVQVNATGNHLWFDRAVLPSRIDSIQIRDLRVGNGHISVDVQRHPDQVRIDIIARSEAIDIACT